MVSFFNIPNGDQSIYYLGQFFGSVGTVLNPAPGSVVFNLIGYLFKGLNTTALIIGALLVTHTTIMGLLKTAQEGEFLGKQWSSLWVPVRMVIGIASLFPTAAGYSVLQIVLMWVIVQGIGAADSLWTIVLNYVNAVGSPYASVPGAPSMSDISQSVESLSQMISCYTAGQKTWGDTYSVQSTHYYYYCADPNNRANSFCTQGTMSSILNETTYTQPICSSNGSMIKCQVGPGGACGSFSFTDPASCNSSATDLGSQIFCAASKSQMVALHQVLNLILEPAANDLVQFDHEYMNFMSNGNPFPTTPAPQWLQNYCAQQGLPTTPNNCCFLGNIPQGTIGLIYKLSTKCQMQPDQGNNTYFAPADAVQGGMTDYGNANATAITNTIWPCGMGPILAGKTGTGASACISSTNNSADFLSGSVTYYEGVVSNAVGVVMTQYMSNPANLSNGSLSNAAEMQAQGWIMAGSYYFQIAGQNNNNLKNSIPKLQVNGNDPLSGNNPFSGYRNNYDAAGNITNIILAQDAANNSSNSGPSITQTAPQLAQMSSSLNSAASGITSSFMHTISGGGAGSTATNPLIAVQSLGEKLMITAQTIYALFLAGSFLAISLSKLNFIFLGAGATENPIGAAVTFVLTAALGVLLAFMAWCFSTGAMLGIYTPLIPYIIFTFGALGWIIATIEAMVAAPFVALGILSPGGHDILGKADAGLMILFNTFLRPSLMIIGMMSGMLLTPLAVTLINATYSGVMGSIDSTPGLFELIIFLTIYVTLIVSVMNKCFALIYAIPDRVLSWLGHRAEPSGSDSSDALGGAKGGSDKAASTTAGAAAGGIKAAGGAKEAYNKAQNARDAKETEANKATVSPNDTGAGTTVQGPRRDDGTF